MSRPSPLPPTRAFARWSLGHALPRTLLSRAGKQGDLHGRMFVATQSSDPALLEPVLDELRAHRPFYRGKYAAVSVDNAAVRELLSHPEASFGVRRPATPRAGSDGCSGGRWRTPRSGR